MGIERYGISIRAVHEGERPKPLPHPKTVYVGVYVELNRYAVGGGAFEAVADPVKSR